MDTHERWRDVSVTGSGSMLPDPVDEMWKALGAFPSIPERVLRAWERLAQEMGWVEPTGLVE
jgi:hypothetical protein